ncbi:mannose-binding protein C-like [Hyalella azteca]|uniref:Mannose-binding protein C-like n=1 Tax=Hyalella azteca TaxID=294128 RepID=A0A8B7P1A8_HYAAZ|nr:mannose-binding protein C-like [Hyalella azteca]
MTYELARTHCGNLGGYLAFPMDDQENSFIRQLVKAQYAWLGGDMIGRNGTFLTSGSAPEGARPIRQTFWNTGEPNNPINEQCIMMIGSGKWNDGSCGSSYNFVCQFPYAGACMWLPHPAFHDLQCYRKA